MALTQAEIQQRIAERQAQPEPDPQYRYVTPFDNAADDLIRTVGNVDGRWMFGITEIDTLTRGLGPSELMYVSGRSHSGKTQVVLNGLVNNPQARAIIFTPDEVAELVLTKLIGITHGINAEELERQIKARHEPTLNMIRKVASQDFQNLVVLDQALRFDQMSQALVEAEHMWGGLPADIVIVDFLELLPGDGDHTGVLQKSQQMKAWAKAHQRPVVALRQNSRSSANRGQTAGMSGMSHGGEAEAIVVMDVYRKREDMTMGETERRSHQNTVTCAVVKNKRPPSRLGEVDLYMDPNCGKVRPLKPGETGLVTERLTPAQVVRRMNGTK